MYLGNTHSLFYVITFTKPYCAYFKDYMATGESTDTMRSFCSRDLRNLSFTPHTYISLLPGKHSRHSKILLKGRTRNKKHNITILCKKKKFLKIIFINNKEK